jgi:hypothetical protein
MHGMYVKTRLMFFVKDFCVFENYREDSYTEYGPNVFF